MIRYRDWRMDQIGANIIVRYVEDSIKHGRVKEEEGPNPSRNGL